MAELYRHVKCQISRKGGMVTCHRYLVIFQVFIPQEQKDWLWVDLAFAQILN